MKEDDCYQLGEVIKTHGLKGEVNIRLDVDYPEEYNELESVFLKSEGKLVPFFVETIHIQGENALVKFEDINSIDDAKPLLKSPLYLPLSLLPKLKDGDYYFHDLIDCDVFDSDERLGTVKSVFDLSGNDLLEVEMMGGKEILIPMNDEILLHVDIKSKKILVSLPDGLLDL